MEPSYISGTSLQAWQPHLGQPQLKRGLSAPVQPSQRSVEALEAQEDLEGAPLPPGLLDAADPEDHSCRGSRGWAAPPLQDLPPTGPSVDWTVDGMGDPYMSGRSYGAYGQEMEWPNWTAGLRGGLEDSLAGPCLAPSQPSWLDRSLTAPPCFGHSWGGPQLGTEVLWDSPPADSFHNLEDFYRDDPSLVTRGVALGAADIAGDQLFAPPPGLPGLASLASGSPAGLADRHAVERSSSAGSSTTTRSTAASARDTPPCSALLEDCIAEAPEAEEAEDALPATPSAGKPAQALAISQNASTGVLRVLWMVDASKLRKSDKVAVSPSFEIADGARSFRVMISPKVVSDRKGGASFKKAKGRGYVQLKCEACEDNILTGQRLTFGVSVGTGAGAQREHSLVEHDFADAGVCVLPKDFEEWDFSKAVDEATQSFAVCLDIYPQAKDV